MEILSPASNMEHIKVAIDEKADAVYGGLKEWNARNKAINFTTKEYNELIDTLHKHNIKFYLTINILMLDEDIQNIIKFLKNNTLPDAFIVSDIGLIMNLKKHFPNVPIHLSTQFGVHNVDDIKYAESLGAERVILARELTLKEVNNLKDHANTELETFIWGSQCLSFSGLCFFGTIINGGGGNRGKCMITCRDVYSVNDRSGHFLYVPDMDCTDLLDELKNIDCLKLEGRRRNPKEISNILRQIKAKEKSNCKRGYLYGTKISSNNLFENVNSRLKGLYKYSDLKEITQDDVFVLFDNEIPVKFSDDYKNENVKYVYSERKQSYDLNKQNISIDLVIKDGIVKEVLYVNYKGDGHTFISKDKLNYIPFTVSKLINDIKEKDSNINIYKIKYYRNENNQYKIDKELYEEIIAYIVNDCKLDLPKVVNNPNFTLPMIYLETDNIEVIDNFIDDDFVKIIYNIVSIQDLEQISRVIEKYKDKIIYKLPLFNWSSIDLMPYYELLKDKEVMFTRLSQIFKTQNIHFKKKYIDYTVYVWNQDTRKYLSKLGIKEFTASPELSYEDNLKIFGKTHFQNILCGNLPMVFTRNCFGHLFGCEKCLNTNIKEINNDDKDMKYSIICKKDYRMIINNDPILNDYTKVDLKNANVSFRYITLNQDLKTIKSTIDVLKDKNYYKKLKIMKTWNKSYECNLFHSKK